jgi:hypothetical protein
MTKDDVQLTVYGSALVLAASVFAPLARLPVVGEVSYHQVATVEAWVICAVAIGTPALMLSSRHRYLLLPPLLVWGTLFFPNLRQRFFALDNNVLEQGGEATARAIADFGAGLFSHILEFRWGGYLMLAALVAFTVYCGVLFFKTR